jgi:hypothetical protein
MKEIFVCSCGSFEHQMYFWTDNDIPLYTEVHLVTHRNFFIRLWRGLRYAFGYRSRFGEWDEFLFGTEDMLKLKEFLNNYNYGKRETK